MEQRNSRVTGSKITNSYITNVSDIIILLFLITGFLTNNNLFYIISGCCLIARMISLSIFRPISIVWNSLSELIGNITTSIILLLIFYFIITPIGILRKCSVRDHLLLNSFKKEGRKSAMKERNHVFEPSNLEMPY
jgi:hypothetical protein